MHSRAKGLSVRLKRAELSKLPPTAYPSNKTLPPGMCFPTSFSAKMYSTACDVCAADGADCDAFFLSFFLAKPLT